jgi:hypothetical protein
MISTFGLQETPKLETTWTRDGRYPTGLTP